MYGLSGRQLEQTEGKSDDSHPDRLMSALRAPVGGIMVGCAGCGCEVVVAREQFVNYQRVPRTILHKMHMCCQFVAFYT